MPVGFAALPFRPPLAAVAWLRALAQRAGDLVAVEGVARVRLVAAPALAAGQRRIAEGEQQRAAGQQG